MKLFIMVVILVVLTSTVLSGGVDLSALTLDELVSLRNNINDEIAIRSGHSDDIYTGEYVVGSDILPGAYSIKCNNSTLNCQAINVSIFDDERTNLLNFDICVGFEGYVSLKEGQTLKIKYGSGTITEVHPSWAP